MKKRTRETIRYILEYPECINKLNEIEKEVLREVYLNRKRRNGATVRLSNNLNYSPDGIEKIRVRAVGKIGNSIWRAKG